LAVSRNAKGRRNGAGRVDKIFAVSDPVLIGIPGATAIRDPIPVSSA
jgi:hypothetical protein